MHPLSKLGFITFIFTALLSACNNPLKPKTQNASEPAIGSEIQELELSQSSQIQAQVGFSDQAGERAIRVGIQEPPKKGKVIIEPGPKLRYIPDPQYEKEETDSFSVQVETSKRRVRVIRYLVYFDRRSNAAPTILDEPESIHLPNKTEASSLGKEAFFLSVVARGAKPMRFQWYKDTHEVNEINNNGAKTPTLRIDPDSENLSGTYYVMITNAFGSVKSKTARVILDPPIIRQLEPTILSQPKSLTVKEGESASFTVSTSGTPPFSFQWFKGNDPIVGATQNTLVLGQTLPQDSGTYSVQIKNAVNTVTSEGAVLTVSPRPAPPTITSHPASITATIGDDVSLSTTVTGPEPMTFQWFKNDNLLQNATSATLSFSKAEAVVSGEYRVKITGPGGAVTSQIATVLVKPPVMAAPVISKQPEDLEITEGEDAVFEVVVSATGILTYQWKKNNQVIPGETGPVLRLTKPALETSGTTFKVIVTGIGGSVTSHEAQLTVQEKILPPTIVQHPSSQSVNTGESVTLAVSATSKAPMTYQWYLNSSLLEGKTQNSLTLANFSADKIGNYTVQISNSAGSVTSNIATLTLIPLAQPPSIVSQSSSLTVKEGEALNLTVTATGTGPLTYVWKKDNVLLPQFTSKDLDLTNAILGDAGDYVVQVSNSAGSVSSAPIRVTITPKPSQIVISDEIAGPVKFSQYDSAYFMAPRPAIADDNTSIEWIVNGKVATQPITPGANWNFFNTAMPMKSETVGTPIKLQVRYTLSPGVTVLGPALTVEPVAEKITVETDHLVTSITTNQLFRWAALGSSHTNTFNASLTTFFGENYFPIQHSWIAKPLTKSCFKPNDGGCVIFTIQNNLSSRVSFSGNVNTFYFVSPPTPKAKALLNSGYVTAYLCRKDLNDLSKGFECPESNYVGLMPKLFHLNGSYFVGNGPDNFNVAMVAPTLQIPDGYYIRPGEAHSYLVTNFSSSFPNLVYELGSEANPQDQSLSRFSNAKFTRFEIQGTLPELP